MSGKGGGKGGGLTFTKQMPKFLQSMREQDDDGIAGALKRHREKHGDDNEPADRSDEEDERPVVVDEEEGLTAKQRRRLDAHESRGGSLRFKDSAKDKFQESAAQRVAAAEEAAALQQQAEAEAEAEAADAAAAAGGHVFHAKASSKAEAKQPKRKLPGSVGAKAVRNEKMLSFSAEDEEDG
jgi:hypothetical protein